MQRGSFRNNTGSTVLERIQCTLNFSAVKVPCGNWSQTEMITQAKLSISMIYKWFSLRWLFLFYCSIQHLIAYHICRYVTFLRFRFGYPHSIFGQIVPYHLLVLCWRFISFNYSVGSHIIMCSLFVVLLVLCSLFFVLFLCRCCCCCCCNNKTAHCKVNHQLKKHTNTHTHTHRHMMLKWYTSVRVLNIV